METRGGSGYRSSRFCIDGLVAFPVEGRIWAGNIGRKGDVSNLLQPGKKVIDGKKPNFSLSERSPGGHCRLQFVILSKKQALSDQDFASGADQAFPVVGIS